MSYLSCHGRGRLIRGLLGVSVGLFVALPAMASTPSVDVRQWSGQGAPINALKLQQGGTAAIGDVDGDGQDEIVVGADIKQEPWVHVYDQSGKLKKAFLAYQKNFKGGVRLAVGDLDGDNIAEIATAPGPGIESRVNVFSGTGQKKHPTGVLAYTQSFVGGAHIAVGDLMGDSKNEIAVSPGPGGGPHIAIFNGALENLGRDFFAFEESMKDGVSIAVAKTRQGNRIVVAPESWSEPLVRQYSLNDSATLVKAFWGAEPGERHGLEVATVDWDNDGVDEIVTSPNGGITSTVTIYDVFGTRWTSSTPYDYAYKGAISVARLPQGSGGGLMTVPKAPLVTGPVTSEKFIDVSIKEQRLYAYEHGRLARTFLVSTGVRKFPTPLMDTTVKRKVYRMDYRWSYGPGNPNNYFLPNVKYNLNISGPYYIHYAYWHNDFGRPKSHGCVNTGYKDAEWIYHWADVGTPVKTRL